MDDISIISSKGLYKKIYIKVLFKFYTGFTLLKFFEHAQTQEQTGRTVV